MGSTIFTSEEIIEKLELEKHPEGGYFREVYRSSWEFSQKALTPAFDGSRSFSTSIYYLLKKSDFSAFHRIASDEIWHFYLGDPLTIYTLNKDQSLSQTILGQDFMSGQQFQSVVNAHHWFAAVHELPEVYGFSLLGCTVAPGFDFKDFELGKRKNLCDSFPQHHELICQLTRK